ncbi:recombinase family protein [Lacrimispora indolis]|uniref:recombinase family protein n=1 Tax=Lacrimispora indolis TaxID=69825 RepID=UPI0003FEEFC3|nr:recombinase family protein [[Clostridium] methoxybenzovorans]
MRCVSYTRTLPWRQEVEPVEILKQNAAISDFIAARKGWTLNKKYSDRKKDESVCASFRQMIQDGMERQFDCIIVYSLYFCGTSFPDVRQMLQETLMAAGIHLVVVSEQFDSTEMSGQQIADYFENKRREMHADIVKRWKKSRGGQFVLTNSVPYGYIRPNGYDHMIKDEFVREIVEEIFQRKKEGQTNRQIFEWLNHIGADTPHTHRNRLQGKPVREGDPWNLNKIRRLFRSQVYTGVLVNDEGEVITENSHEAYISHEDFLSFPENKERPKQNNRVRYKNPNPLASKIYCADCNSRLHQRSNFDTGEIHFICAGNCRHDEDGKPVKVSADAVTQTVMGWFHQEQALAKKANEFFHRHDFRNQRLERRAELSIRMQAILAEMELEQFRRVPLYEQYSSGALKKEEYQEEYIAFWQACEELDRRLSEVMEEAKNLEVAFSIKNPWIVLFTQTNIPDTLDKYIVTRLIDRVIVKLSESKPDRQIVIIPKFAEWKKQIIDFIGEV